ncbi:hypothetical protein BXZ70DRAFT_281340 [Cristinia sonorae]|uniref:Uncharacterized protein n=1 Tax=Cristinia sonorae TaxID=1940300 RepID=A0A8K0UYR7_9AGAR|nr:hypothetical protein BXZ70DRAFT_281340 [Cristinia sonorae]
MPVSEKTLISIEEAIPGNDSESDIERAFLPQWFNFGQLLIVLTFALYFGLLNATAVAALHISLGLVMFQSYHFFYAPYLATEIRSWIIDFHNALSYIKIAMIGAGVQFLAVYSVGLLLAALLVTYYKYREPRAREHVQDEEGKVARGLRAFLSSLQSYKSPRSQMCHWMQLLLLVPIGIATIRWSMNRAEWDAAASRGELQVGVYEECPWSGWAVYGVSVVDAVVALTVGEVTKIATKGLYRWLRPQALKLEDKDMGGN